MIKYPHWPDHFYLIWISVQPTFSSNQKPLFFLIFTSLISLRVQNKLLYYEKADSKCRRAHSICKLQKKVGWTLKFLVFFAIKRPRSFAMLFPFWPRNLRRTPEIYSNYYMVSNFSHMHTCSTISLMRACGITGIKFTTSWLKMEITSV